MGASSWTRTEVCDLIAGKRIFLRAADGAQLSAPDWMASVAAEVSALDSVQSVDATHPDDRNLLIEAFILAVQNPGIEVPCHLRAQLDGVWRHSEIVWVNLLDQPDVGAIVGTARDVDGPPIAEPSRTVEGVMDATNWMIVTLDEMGYIESVRGRLEEILGYDEDQVRGRLLTEYIHPDCIADAIENWLSLQENPGQTRTSRWVWCRGDGAEVWLESSYLMHDDRLVEVVVVDVNDQVANEQALAASQRELAALAEDFRLLADEVPTAVFRCDATGAVQFHNAIWDEMFAELGPVTRVHDVVDPSARAELDTLLQALVAKGTTEPCSIEVATAGAPRVVEIRCRAVTDAADQTRFVGSISDVTVAARFRHQALHDPLTGLANRAMVESMLDEAIRVHPAGTLVVFIDLDGFKAVNDDHGHAAGDAVLVEIARRLANAVRPGDLVGRYGGDEFVVVCRDVRRDDDTVIVDRLEAVFDRAVVLDGLRWTAAASIGLARPEPDVDSATILRRADQAMFEQKRLRRLR